MATECISHRAVGTTLENQMDLDLIAPRGGSVPEFLRKPITTCYFPLGGPDPLPLPLDSPTRVLQKVIP